MASSTHYGGATAAPPPTPSSQAPNQLSSSDAGDLLSRLLHRLPPTLSLPTRRSQSAAAPPTVTVSFINQSDAALASQFGYFQLIDHPITPQLARSAESDSASLFSLEKEKKRAVFDTDWPLGYDCDDEGEESSESFCVDASVSESVTELDLSSLTELTRQMEKIGLKMIELLSSAAGFENPTRDDPCTICPLMWVSAETESYSSHDQVNLGRLYPYVVGLTYQLRTQKYSLLGDSGWLTVSPQVDSVMVTVGDIAQVWSNGKLKKVRGRPVPNMVADSSCKENKAPCITMTLLMTLRPDSIAQPLILPKAIPAEDSNETEKTEEANTSSTSNSTRQEGLVFNSFPFEDYAWRVYNDRIVLGDPLDRYRI